MLALYAATQNSQMNFELCFHICD